MDATSRWIQSAHFDETRQFLCWQVGGEILTVELNLLPELISALMLMIEDAVEVEGAGVLVDLEMFGDIQRLLDEMHVQYREES
jgi:hypothetical protein